MKLEKWIQDALDHSEDEVSKAVKEALSGKKSWKRKPESESSYMVDFTPREITTVEEIGLKMRARILLQGSGTGRVIVPRPDDIVGLHLLERDDEMPPRLRSDSRPSTAVPSPESTESPLSLGHRSSSR